ncbi:MAG TPA: biopolymer transporter ExbD [Planctomycetaceae bacterium]|nr:biopolymer transporter ExbD [Planctomycetaceae bacterium]
MRVRRAGQREEKIELMMTPMIDVVFQLLVFFVMTFKIVEPEGDFNIKMPLAAPSEGIPPIDALPPMPVRLRAGPGGRLASMQFGNRPLESFAELRQAVRRMVGDEAGPGRAADAEVELDCDYDLRYEYVVEAITAVSGYIDQNNQVHKIVEKIRFAPPRPPAQ